MSIGSGSLSYRGGLEVQLPFMYSATNLRPKDLQQFQSNIITCAHNWIQKEICPIAMLKRTACILGNATQKLLKTLSLTTCQ